jgi:putative tryptophan/tyrosine transport system substrate-binding protein
MMRALPRRQLLLALACAVPGLKAQTTTRKVAVLMGNADEPFARAMLAGLRKGLAESGFTEGSNLVLDVAWGSGDVARMRENALAAAARGYDAYMAQGASALREAMKAVSTKPIVFWGVSDPLGNGFVDDLARPGRNASGFSLYSFEMAGKWLQLMRDVLPSVRRVVILMGAQNANLAGWRRQFAAVAPGMGFEVVWPEPRSSAELESTLQKTVGVPHTALLVLADPFLSSGQNRQLIQHYGALIPAVTANRAIGGPLVVYEVDQPELARQAGGYVARVLRGGKIQTLPVQAPTRYRLVLDRRTARALGIEFPRSLLVRADEIVD